jgi:putative Mn2+ efflux pump MntP
MVHWYGECSWIYFGIFVPYEILRSWAKSQVSMGCLNYVPYGILLYFNAQFEEGSKRKRESLMFGLVVFAFIIVYNLLFHNTEIQVTVSQWAPTLYLWHYWAFIVLQFMIGIGTIATFIIYVLEKINKDPASKYSLKIFLYGVTTWLDSIPMGLGFIFGSLSLMKYAKYADCHDSQFLLATFLMYLVGFYYAQELKSNKFPKNTKK